MRFLSRAVFVLVLLGGLGYGSYAFGRYVLSSKLFGTSVLPSDKSGLVAVKPPTVVTRKTQYKGSEPRVEVQVMDADSAGPGPEPPSIDDLRRNAEDRAQSREDNPSPQRTPATILRKSGDQKNIDDGAIGDEDSDASDRHRRRRRRKRSAEERAAQEAAQKASPDGTSDSGTARSSSTDAGGSSSASEVPVSEGSARSSAGSSESGDPGSGGSEVPRAERTITSSDSATSESKSEAKPRRRRRHHSSSSLSTTSAPDVPRERSRERPSRTIESPVPRPEGSESPVPLPE